MDRYDFADFASSSSDGGAEALDPSIINIGDQQRLFIYQYVGMYCTTYFAWYPYENTGRANLTRSLTNIEAQLIMVIRHATIRAPSIMLEDMGMGMRRV